MNISAASFEVTRNPSPASDERRAEILSNPGFGQFFSDHMVSIEFSDGEWKNPKVEPYASLTIDPSAMVFHYGQAIFEGLKIYRWSDGTLRAFRPEQNARRMNRSAERMAMPQLDEEVFLESLRQLLAVDGQWTPEAGGEDSLYIRPFMISTEVGLGVRPADRYLFLMLASPAGAYFSGGISPVTVWLTREYVRAAPGGTGAAKFAGNYAASLKAQAEAIENDCDQVVWLDAAEHKYIEEMGGMNLFFVYGEGDDAELVTPELSGSLLPGVTRASLIQLAEQLGMKVSERRISIDDVEAGIASGELTEAFACGTAAVITPVGHFKGSGEDFVVADGGSGPVTLALREKLTGIQRGSVADDNGWMVQLS